MVTGGPVPDNGLVRMNRREINVWAGACEDFLRGTPGALGLKLSAVDRRNGRGDYGVDRQLWFKNRLVQIISLDGARTDVRVYQLPWERMKQLLLEELVKTGNPQAVALALKLAKAYTARKNKKGTRTESRRSRAGSSPWKPGNGSSWSASSGTSPISPSDRDTEGAPGLRAPV